jgi:hypothetical protein
MRGLWATRARPRTPLNAGRDKPADRSNTVGGRATAGRGGAEGWAQRVTVLRLAGAGRGGGGGGGPCAGLAAVRRGTAVRNRKRGRKLDNSGSGGTAARALGDLRGVSIA